MGGGGGGGWGLTVFGFGYCCGGNFNGVKCMPFRSEAQRRWMWANRPDVARRWEAEGKGRVVGGGGRRVVVRARRRRRK